MGRRRLAAAIISIYFTLAFNCRRISRRRRRRDPAQVAAASWPSRARVARPHSVSGERSFGRSWYRDRAGTSWLSIIALSLNRWDSSQSFQKMLVSVSAAVGVTARVPDTVTFRSVNHRSRSAARRLRLLQGMRIRNSRLTAPRLCFWATAFITRIQWTISKLPTCAQDSAHDDNDPPTTRNCSPVDVALLRTLDYKFASAAGNVRRGR